MLWTLQQAQCCTVQIWPSTIIITWKISIYFYTFSGEYITVNTTDYLMFQSSTTCFRMSHTLGLISIGSEVVGTKVLSSVSVHHANATVHSACTRTAYSTHQNDLVREPHAVTLPISLSSPYHRHMAHFQRSEEDSTQLCAHWIWFCHFSESLLCFQCSFCTDALLSNTDVTWIITLWESSINVFHASFVLKWWKEQSEWKTTASNDILQRPY